MFHQDSTLEVGEVMESLQNAVKVVKDLDSMDMLKVIKNWKQRALEAEEKFTSMEEEITQLKKEVTTWQGRARRAELRFDRRFKAEVNLEQRERNKHLAYIFDDEGDEEQDDITSPISGSGKKLLLNQNKL